MTPAEFAKRMQAVLDDYNNNHGDREQWHREADDLICEVLKSIGYEEGVKIYDSEYKWHS